MTLTGPLSRFLSVFLACVLAVSLVPSAQALAETDQTGLAQESEAAQEDATSEAGDESLAGEDVASDDATTEQEQLDRGETILKTEKSDQEIARSNEADPSVEPQISAQASSLQEQAAEILKDCAVQIDHEGSFTAEDTGTHVSVRLSDQVSRCNLTLFAYASNTGFDPDSSQNIRLWSGMVTDGWESDVNFNASTLPLKSGYSVIACLNVPITDDYYRSCNSAPVAIVDENGEGFQDYVYPDAFIVEDELEAGATSLHVSVTGDDRLFQAAREGKISMTLSVAQYPADDDFDFESFDQIALCSPIDVTEAIDGEERVIGKKVCPF